ncbi:MAG: Na+/H+ antiporter subunit E [Agarilytica sp.]
MRHTVYLVIALAAIWLLNSGHYNPLLLGLGALSIAFVTWIARKMDVVDHESQPVSFTHKLPLYWLWLSKEIVLANIDVVKRIWRGVDAIDPTVAVLKPSQKNDLGRVIYANSITLTPGTVTLDLKDDEVLVHAISKEGIEALKLGDMDKRVTRLES